jgi:hypothetical protein
MARTLAFLRLYRIPVIPSERGEAERSRRALAFHKRYQRLLPPLLPNQFPSLNQMLRQFILIHVLKLNTDPAFYPDIGRIKIFLRRRLQQRCLISGLDRHVHCDMSIIVMIVREHRIDLLCHEERRLAMRNLLGASGQTATQAPNALDLSLANARDVEPRCFSFPINAATHGATLLLRHFQILPRPGPCFPLCAFVSLVV